MPAAAAPVKCPALVDGLHGVADRVLEPKLIQYGAQQIMVHWLPDLGSSVTLRIAYPIAPTAAAGGPYRGGGAFTRAQLSAKRPLYLRFEVETEALRVAKRDGINREIQTGDPAFDDAVYIDSPSDDAIVLEVLHSSVRAAVRALLAAGAHEVEIDNPGGHCTVTFIGTRERSEVELRAILDTFVALVGALPPLDKAGEQPSPDGRVITTLVIVTLIAIVLAMMAGVTSLIGGGHAFIGASCGFVVGLPLILLPRYRGRSNSAEQRSIAGGLLLFLATSIGTIIGACW